MVELVYTADLNPAAFWHTGSSPVPGTNEKEDMKKVYIENWSQAYVDLFQRVLGCDVVYNHEAADFVVFTGGEDVSPYLYKDHKHRSTFNNIDRDVREKALFDQVVKTGKPMVGICRGAQFLNVMSGGRMYQDVDEHGRSHPINDTRSGDVIFVTSTHHQMMLPGKMRELVATAQLRGRREWFNREVPVQDWAEVDYEVVWYPHTKCLCFQPHPEMYAGVALYDGMRAYFQKLLTRYGFL